MPELPDITAYVEALQERVAGEPLEGVRIADPFVLRSVSPAPAETQGRKVEGVRRLGKRIVLALEGDLFIVLHLMIAGRLQWKRRGTPIRKKTGVAALDFPSGSVLLTEAATKKRAAFHVVRGADLALHDPGGLEVLESSLENFRKRLVSENHTLKRALTDPRLFSGIGNAYSDEILHHARLSPMKLTQRLDEASIERLYHAIRNVLCEWCDRLREERAGGFPEKVTAFRPEMAVHGKYGKPCPVCGSAVQRIQYAENEANYCAVCQTEGRLLADRGLSRLMRSDWPRTLEEMEERRASQRSE